MRIDPASTSTAINTLFLGAAVFPQAIGAGAMSPQDQEHADWMYWEAFSVAKRPSDEVYLWPIYVRSMRKMSEVGEDLSLHYDASGTDFELAWTLSILLLLP